MSLKNSYRNFGNSCLPNSLLDLQRSWKADSLESSLIDLTEQGFCKLSFLNKIGFDLKFYGDYFSLCDFESLLIKEQ
jgi:hypothetical protein